MISPHSPLYDRAEVMAGRKSPPRDRDSSCSSSIGRNSDWSSAGSEGVESGEAEVQSALRGPLDTMDLLELGLPISDMSNFYRGKSKSLTNLNGGDSPWSAAADLAAKLACTISNRKRKKQQPALLFRDNRDSSSTPPKPPPPTHGRLPKRLAEVNQSMPSLGTRASAAVASSSSGSNSSATSFEEDDDAVSGSWLPHGLLAARRRGRSR